MAAIYQHLRRPSLTRRECSMHRHDPLSLWHRGIAMTSLWHRYDLAMTSLWPRYGPQRGSGFRETSQRFWETFWWERMRIKGRSLLHSQDLLNCQISHQFAFRRLLFIILFQLSVHWRLQCLRDVLSRVLKRLHIARSQLVEHRRHRLLKFATVNLNRHWISSRLSFSSSLFSQVKWIVS